MRSSTERPKTLQIPEDAPPIAFPIMPDGKGIKLPEKGVNLPDWAELSVIAYAILGLCPEQDDSINIMRLRREVKRLYRQYDFDYTNKRFINLLNDLKDRGIVTSPNQSGFIFSKDYSLTLNIPPRMLAVWADHVAVYFIKDDLEKAIREENIYPVLEEYSTIAEKWRLYPVERNYPVLKAITLLDKDLQEKLRKFMSERYENKKREPLVDSVFLMLDEETARQDWLTQQTQNIEGKEIYSIAAEISFLAGGLGRVMHYHGEGYKRLGANVAYIEPMYNATMNNPKIDYSKDLPIPLRQNEPTLLKKLNTMVQGKTVDFEVWTGTNANDIPVYFIKHLKKDTDTHCYTDTLYKYDERGDTAVSPAEFAEFFTKATAELLNPTFLL